VTQRDVGAGFRASVEASYSRDMNVSFLTVWHPSTSKVIRVANDKVKYQYGGEIFDGAPFDLIILSDDEDKPVGKISIQNVDEEIGQTIKLLEDSPWLKIEVTRLSQFSAALDPSLNARTELGSTIVSYTANFLRMSKVSVNPMAITADIVSRDYSQEPVSRRRVTKNVAAALFR
jgi:hypothetical protein